MFSQSFTGYFLSKIFSGLKRCVSESAVFSFFSRLLEGFSECVRGSLVYNWLGKSVFTEKFYSSSLFYGALNAILRFVTNVIRSVCGALSRAFDGSLTLYAASKVTGAKYFRIDVFLALFIGVMFAAPHERWNNLFLALAGTLFGAWTLISIATGKIKRKRAEGINLSIIVFLLAVFASVALAASLSDAVRIMLFIVSSIIIAFAIYASVDTKEKLEGFMKIVLFFVALTAVYAIIQRLMGVEVDEEFVDLTVNEGMPGRVFSTFANPNNFAELLILFMPFFVPLALFAKKALVRICAAGGFVLCLAALLMTYSRSCWVGFALAAVFFTALYDKRLLVPLALLALVAVPFLPSSIMNRIFTIGSMKDSSNSYRLYIWDSCLRMLKDYFATGIGLAPSSFRAVYPGYASSIAVTAPHSHMLYLEIWLETGLMGIIGFFGFIYTIVKRAAGRMRAMDREVKTYAIAALSALLGIAFVCCAEYIWFYPRVMAAFWIVAAMALSAASLAKENTGG